MILDEEKLREYLACYGADVAAWPEDIRIVGRNAERHTRFSILFTEERRFEQLLCERHFVPASANLIQRIISTAFTKVQYQGYEWGFSDLFTGIKPAALAATLVLGFAIGFGALAPIMQSKKEAFMQLHSDDDGAVL